MSRFPLLLLLVVLPSCVGSEPDDSQARPIDTPETTGPDGAHVDLAEPVVVEPEPAAEALPVAPEEVSADPPQAQAETLLDLDQLAEYFTAEEIALINEYDGAFHSASTDVELREVYRQMFGLAERLLVCDREAWQRSFYSGVEDPACGRLSRLSRQTEDVDEQFARESELGIPGLLPTRGSHVSGAAFVVHTPAWRDAATGTPSEGDEIFFSLLPDFYGFDPRLDPQHQVNGFFNECITVFTFCEEGWTNLGQGHYKRLLAQIDQYGEHEDAFSGDVAAYRATLMESLSETVCVVGSAEDALSELEDIQASVKLSDDERATLAAKMDALRAPRVQSGWASWNPDDATLVWVNCSGRG